MSNTDKLLIGNISTSSMKNGLNRNCDVIVEAFSSANDSAELQIFQIDSW